MTPEAMKAEIERLATERNALDVQVAALEEQLAEERARFKEGWEAGREAAALAVLMSRPRIGNRALAGVIRDLPAPEGALLTKAVPLAGAPTLTDAERAVAGDFVAFQRMCNPAGGVSLKPDPAAPAPVETRLTEEEK